MSVYVRDKETGIYYIRFECLGVKVHKSAHTRNRTEAKNLEAEWRQEIREQQLLGKRCKRSFDDLMEAFIEDHLPTLKPSAQRRYLTSIKQLIPYFGGRPLSEINRQTLSEYAKERRKHVSTSTIRKDLACLSSAFSLAIGWDWVDLNPVQLLDKRQIKESAPRTRWLTWEEYESLLNAAPDYMKDAITLCVCTGLRTSELFSLEWKQVNWGRREIVLPVTKTDTPRAVPLTAFENLGYDCLENVKRNLKSSYILCKKNGEPYEKMTRGLTAAVVRAGLKHTTWHDLRRTCGSWLLQSGMDIYKVSRWLGHKSVSQTERAYAFLNSESLHEAAQNLPHRTRIIGNMNKPEKEKAPENQGLNQ